MKHNILHQQCNPMHLYLEVRPIEFNGTYSHSNEHMIVVKKYYSKINNTMQPYLLQDGAKLGG